MVAFVRDVLGQVRPSDLLDVVIVAALIYAVLCWLRDRASRSIVVALVGLFTLFLLARSLDLYLTTLAFNVGWVVIVVVLVVVFQQDIRNGFERLAAFSLRRKMQGTPDSRKWLDALAEAIANLAKDRIGALIVLPGREPLDRHLRGGVQVDGRVSLPLLMSIFHPKSAGHDGAILIEDGRVVSLGIHLPLTRNMERVPDSGTRHAAALGLAELSDAMVIAVSEERGTITLGHDGSLTIVESAAVLERIVEHLPDVTAGANRRQPLFDGPRLVAAIIAACILWFTFAYTTEIVQRTLVVPIEYRNIPAGLEIDEPRSNFAEVTLSGSEPAFTLLDPSTMMVSIDTKNSGDANGVAFAIKKHLKGVPRELQVESVNPESVFVFLRQAADRSR